MSSEDYAHGWAILPLAAFFAYQRLQYIPPPSSPRDVFVGRWIVCLLPGIALLELVRLAPIPWRLVLWMIYALAAASTLGLAWRRYGAKTARSMIFPVGFAAFSVPWPTSLEAPLVQFLGVLIAQGAGQLLAAVGIYTQVQGRIIELASGPLAVEEACSGIRSLNSGVMIALVLGEWHRLSATRRLGLIGAAFITAVLLNTLRTFFLAQGVSRHGPVFLENWHDPAAFAALFALCGILVLIARLARTGTTPAPPFRWHPELFAGKPGLGTLGAVLALTSAHIWYVTGSPATAAPFSSTDFPPGLQITEASAATKAVLGTERAVYVHPPAHGAGQSLAYHIAWNSSHGFALIHRPDICMPGGGWISTTPPRSFTTALAGRPAHVTAYTFQRRGDRIHLYWSAWISGRPLLTALNNQSLLQIQLLPELILQRQRRTDIEILAFARFQATGAVSAAELSQLVELYGLSRD
jgi:exosortase